MVSSARFDFWRWALSHRYAALDAHCLVLVYAAWERERLLDTSASPGGAGGEGEARGRANKDAHLLGVAARPLPEAERGPLARWDCCLLGLSPAGGEGEETGGRRVRVTLRHVGRGASYVGAGALHGA